ncbi:hypothetical protein V8C35DRAFT_279728 [Trichoderma chlorosporum]
MKKVAAAANMAPNAESHGDHLLQGGQAIMKEDPEEFNIPKSNERMAKQSGLGGAKPDNLQGSAGTGAEFGDMTNTLNTTK